jgi:hypothetical protein
MLKVLAGQRHDKGTRVGGVELARQRQDCVRGELMGETSRASRQIKFAGVNVTWLPFAGNSGVHKDDAFGAAHGFSQFWCELMRPQDLDIHAGKLSFECIGGAPSDAVITAHRIAVSDD